MLQNLAILSFLGTVLCVDVGEWKMAISEVSNITIATPDIYLGKPFNRPISNFRIGISLSYLKAYVHS